MDASRARSLPATMAAYAACAWAVAFAAPHFWWALGVSAGFPGNTEDYRAAFGRTWFLVYDLVAGFACVAATLVALALGRSWGRRIPYRILLAAAWGTCALLVLRGGLGVLLLGWNLLGTATGDAEQVHPMSLVIEPWFLIGGVLFGVAARGYRRT